jgi:hypothetical protein
MILDSLVYLITFIGVEGLTHRPIKSGIKIRVGIDLDSSYTYAYKIDNKAKFIGADIREISGKQIKEYWHENFMIMHHFIFKEMTRDTTIF